MFSNNTRFLFFPRPTVQPSSPALVLAMHIIPLCHVYRCTWVDSSQCTISCPTRTMQPSSLAMHVPLFPCVKYICTWVECSQCTNYVQRNPHHILELTRSAYTRIQPNPDHGTLLLFIQDYFGIPWKYMHTHLYYFTFITIKEDITQ